MSSIADMLGVQWEGARTSQEPYTLTYHAQKTAALKGFKRADVHETANNPHHTYPNGRDPSQVRHVRNGIVAVVNPATREVVTVYKDQEETAKRSDQTDPDAIAYENRRRNSSQR